jgi:prephenate dehydrogenase
LCRQAAHVHPPQNRAEAPETRPRSDIYADVAAGANGLPTDASEGSIVAAMGRDLTRARLAGQGAGLTVGIVGCGLIGGSLGLAVRRRWPEVEVVGVDRPRVRAAALRRQAIGRAATRRELWAHLADLDILLLATPVDAIVQDLGRLPPRGGPLTIDVGSVKGRILDAAGDLAHFVGGHPMAGSERGGIAEASASLFDDRPFVLVPGARATRSDLADARRFVREIGARPIVLDAATHDRCVALVSHLPHLLAFSLMHEGRRLARELDDDLPWSLAAGSWRDATRVAASDPKLWSSIFAMNRDALVPTLERYIRSLEEAAAALRRSAPSARVNQARGKTRRGRPFRR